MRSTSAQGSRRRAPGRSRRRLGALCCAVLGLSAVLVPASSAAGESSGPTSRAVPASGMRATAGPHGPASLSRVESDISRVLRDSPGAVRTGPLEVSWDGGAVVSTWVVDAGANDVGDPAALRLEASGSAQRLAASGYAGCPDGTFVHWFCFYEHASFGGRMLQFRDCPSTQSLASYGFANQTTSWVNNRSGVTITVYDGSTNGTVLWREYGRSNDANVGSWANDRADTFTCRT